MLLTLRLLSFKHPSSPTSNKTFRDLPNHHNRYLIHQAIRRAKLANIQTISYTKLLTKPKTLTVTTIRTKLYTSPTTTSLTKTTKFSGVVHRRGIIKVLKTMLETTMIKSSIATSKTNRELDSTASQHNNNTRLRLWLLHISLYHKYLKWVLWPLQHNRWTAMYNNHGQITRLIRFKATFLTTKPISNQI